MLESRPTPNGSLGVEVLDFDVRETDAETAAEIRALVHGEKLVVFHGQELSTTEYIAFAAALGQPQIYFQENYHHPDHPEIFVSSNRPLNGEKVGVAGTGRYWHSDYQFFEEPLPMTMVSPQQVPSGRRGTNYIDMEAVNAALPEGLRALAEGTRAVHEAKWRYKITPEDVDKSITEILEEFGALTPTVTHPTVITHPATGARCLYVSRGFTVGLAELERNESLRVIGELFDFIERDEHVHFQPWELGDILLWDNRQVVHRASETPPGEPSVSYRIGVYDGLPFYADEARGRLYE